MTFNRVNREEVCNLFGRADSARPLKKKKYNFRNEKDYIVIDYNVAWFNKSSGKLDNQDSAQSASRCQKEALSQKNHLGDVFWNIDAIFNLSIYFYSNKKD